MISLYPLCSQNKIALRDGYTGPSAKIPLPNYNYGSGYWFASGQRYTFPSGEIGQQLGLTERATNQKNPFVKAAGVCNNA